MNKNYLMMGAGILVMVLLGWYFLQGQKSYTPSTTQVLETPLSPLAEMKENLVVIGDNGFSPKEITIKVGELITWKNETLENHTVNSSSHPAHTDYTPLNLGNIPLGENKSLSFPVAGTYKYHDHLNSSSTGSVKVE